MGIRPEDIVLEETCDPAATEDIDLNTAHNEPQMVPPVPEVYLISVIFFALCNVVKQS